jgi:hypothetical protein
MRKITKHDLVKTYVFSQYADAIIYVLPSAKPLKFITRTSSLLSIDLHKT